MRLALLSDIHSNIQAFDACLSHARARGARQFALLGDFVGYGGDPQAVVAQVQALVGQGAWVIKGNHDAMALKPPVCVKTMGESSAAWTHAQLDPAQLAFLDNLPYTLELGSTLLVHGSAHLPEQWRYVQDTLTARASLDAAAPMRHVFGGHVHFQTLYGRTDGLHPSRYGFIPGAPVPVPAARQWLATLGSVGQPRDGNPHAMYAVFDTERFELTFERVDYDHAKAAESVRRAGLPDFFAERLELGR
jgi:diadenosine tetraphosphatase ApaH/serine/threonine PP2A family protein phosphatase